MRFFIGLMGASLLVAACSQPDSAAMPGPDLAAEEEAIRAANAQWLEAAKAKDPAGEASFLAMDGVIYREHIDPIVGPGAFQTYIEQEYANNPQIDVTWTTRTIQVGKGGDLAVQTGDYHVMHLGPNGDGADEGRFVTVWKKVDGAWKVAEDIGSSTMPEPTP